jgi:DUF1016 N-terminal domain
MHSIVCTSCAYVRWGGSRVIDRLAADLRGAFPEMKGFSPRNLKYMRAFAAAWPEREIVRASLAQLTWYHHIALLEKLDNPASQLWYAARTMEHGWSRNILALQIDAQAHRRTRHASPSPVIGSSVFSISGHLLGCVECPHGSDRGWANGRRTAH